jgi:signal transduction histidine kinase
MQQKLSEQNRRLQESFEALRRLQELRENLTNMLAQDMRGPLVTIESHLELLERLQGPKLDEKGRDYVSKSRQAIAGLIEKADSLLDLARLEGDQLPEWFKSA